MVQTIEKTGKKWKGMMAVGVVTMLTGAASGVVIILVANVRAWWSHG